jgi:ABC-type dipeptide/oligopeptide/nickel transport system ATPase component
MIIELDLVVRCPTCGAQPGYDCRVTVQRAKGARRAATHAARRIAISRMTASCARFGLVGVWVRSRCRRQSVDNQRPRADTPWCLFLLENRNRERERRAKHALEAVGLGKRGSHLPHEISGGERQRVAIARSLVNNPSLILADEPTGNLDSLSGTAIMDLLFDLQRVRGMTLVLVTHDATHARRCTRQIQIRDGQVFEKAAGRPREVAK